MYIDSRNIYGHVDGAAGGVIGGEVRCKDVGEKVKYKNVWRRFHCWKKHPGGHKVCKHSLAQCFRVCVQEY